jgi:hypothetical protein
MQETDPNKSIRVRLGPVAADLVADHPEVPAAALETEIALLISDRHKLAETSDLIALYQQRDIQQTEILTNLAATSRAQTDAIDALSQLVDHRTRELSKLMQHIGALIGNRMTEGNERELLHLRFEEIFMDLGKQMDALSKLVTGKTREAVRQSSNLNQQLDEHSLTLPLKVVEEKIIPIKDRGHER